MSKDDEIRFLAKVEKSSRCWKWTGFVDKSGYGKFYMAGETWYAHRAAFMLFCGEINEGCGVEHTCGNKRCVNPKHLKIFEGTREMFSSRKLTEDKVRSIRKAYASGTVTCKALAEKFKVSEGCISKIVRKVSWKNVD